MSNRRKLPVPPSLLSSLPLAVEIEVIDLEIPLPVQREKQREQLASQEEIRETAQQLMEAALDSLRMDGVSEQQIALLLSAVRIESLVKLLDLDLYRVAKRHYESDGATISPNRAVAAALVPELKDRVR